jgi:hypothetical protein
MSDNKQEQSKNGLKRSWGIILLKMGACMCAVLFITSLFMKIPDGNIALDVIYSVFVGAFSLLGLNTVEKLKNIANSIKLNGDK